MVEQTSNILSDSTYDKNFYVRYDDAVKRANAISDVDYNVKIGLPRGEHFGGFVEINFKMAKPE
jgi:hypothetical protein